MRELKERLYDMANHKIVVLPNHARHILYEAADRNKELEAEVKLLKLLNRKSNEAIGFAVSRAQAAQPSAHGEVVEAVPFSLLHDLERLFSELDPGWNSLTTPECVIQLVAINAKLETPITEAVKTERKGLHNSNDWQELIVAFLDATDAIDFAASEGFEWPTDPFTPDIKAVIERYGELKVNK